MKVLYRVEAYDGCSLTLYGPFEQRDDARRYGENLQVAFVRIVDVDQDGAALPLSLC